MKLLFYTSSLTARLQYISSVLINALGIEFNLTTDIVHFNAFEGGKINYSFSPVSSNEFRIYPVELLFESNIKEQPVNCFQWKETKAFFKTPSGDFPFDIFAASFYLLTRYEEYLPHDKDEYGRYAHKNSLAFKQDFLHLPVINLWLQEFAMLLQQRFPSLKFNSKQFQFIPTYDIDIAWSYFSKGFVRNAGGMFKSLMTGQWAMAEERLSVIMGNRDDPFDVYAWLDELHEEYKLKPVYFFLLAKHPGKYDKNISPKNRFFQLLISKLSVMYKTGIHPSWQSGDDKNKFQNELQLLINIIDKPIVNSRQHYIRMNLPATYRLLLEAGIKNDYSMGYGSINGFRASYCLPYKWYDLEKGDITDLTIYPFCFMEANSLFEQHYSAPQALKELELYYQVTKAVNGTLITIFHNHLLTMRPPQIDWREMYEKFLNDHFKVNK